MRLNSKQLKSLGRIKHQNEKPMTVGPISASGKLHVYLGRNQRNYHEMLKMYVSSYDQINKSRRRMSLGTVKLLYRGSRTGKDLWLGPSVGDCLLTAAENYMKNGFTSPDQRPYRFYKMMMRIHDELKPIEMNKRQLRFYLINSGKRLLVISNRFPGTPILFNLRRTIKIYNRFHKDQYPLNRHYLVMTLPLGEQPMHGRRSSAQLYNFYDYKGEVHTTILANAVNNALLQMTQPTAKQVIKNIKVNARKEELESGKLDRSKARKIVMQRTVDAYQVTDELINKAKYDDAW